MNCTHFYHLFAAGEWREPVGEHLAALADGGFDGPFIVGLVGPPAQRAQAHDELAQIRRPDATIEADDGWEQVTLDLAHQYAHQHDGQILYAHTKGASNPCELNTNWRRTMSYHVVRGWRSAAERIAAGDADAVGCHWLTAQMRPDVVDTPFFGGSFWIASNQYLRSLPPLQRRHRYDAERWIGLGDPRIIDLWPGWPGNYHQLPAPLPYRSLSTCS